MKVEIPVYIENIADAIADALSGEISEVSGVGNDSDSEYEVTDISVEEKGGQFIATFEVARISGKFASKDDIQSAINDVITSVEITATLESAL